MNEELLALQPNLHRFALSLTANEADAKDLVQEAMLRAMVYKDKFEQGTSYGAWVFTILKNTFINQYRKKVTHGTVAYEDVRQQADAKQAYSTPESELRYKELEQEVGKLRPIFRIPFQLHVAGYKYREIAERLNLKVGTVKIRIFFAKRELMKSIKR